MPRHLSANNSLSCSASPPPPLRKQSLCVTSRPFSSGPGVVERLRPWLRPPSQVCCDGRAAPANGRAGMEVPHDCFLCMSLMHVPYADHAADKLLVHVPLCMCSCMCSCMFLMHVRCLCVFLIHVLMHVPHARTHACAYARPFCVSLRPTSGSEGSVARPAHSPPPPRGLAAAAVSASVSTRQIWTALQHDGPDHLGLWLIRRRAGSSSLTCGSACWSQVGAVRNLPQTQSSA